MKVVEHWADCLGLAVSPLFGPYDTPASGQHVAMLDGRSGSFAWSLLDSGDVPASLSRSWRWSSDLAHHIELTADEVRVRTGRDDERRFSRSSVEKRLGDFFKFLEAPRHSTLPDVVSFLLDEFVQIWATLPGGTHQGHEALATFLVALSAAGELDPSIVDDGAWRQQRAAALGLDAETIQLVAHLSDSTLLRARSIQERAPMGIRLAPSLVLRHAAGRLFQDAHARLENAQLGLFGDSAATLAANVSPTGAYFTPVPLARLLAESALDRWTALPDEVRIADYACGSGVFLTEALRVLERRGYQGRVRLIGRDISSEAVTMARVAIAAVTRDLQAVDVQSDIGQTDALQLEDWPAADVILMNPPFRSWERMTKFEQEWVRSTLPKRRGGRADLSVGFVSRALNALAPGGSLATLVPAGVLASDSLASWRSGLLDQATPTLIAILGEHGLFRHALVNVGVVTLRKEPQSGSSKDGDLLTLAWAAPESGAAADAMRAIRRTSREQSCAYEPQIGRTPWNVTQTTVATLRDRPFWLPGANALGPLLDTIRVAVPTRVEDLFDVRQGIRTGDNDVFVQSVESVNKLPKGERKWFIPAVVTDSFAGGIIESAWLVFMADPTWETEKELVSAVPRFFERVLAPARERLKKRAGINPTKWWMLTRSRGWTSDGTPRLVSKRFGLIPAFARDPSGEMAVVQANAWIPKPALTAGGPDRALGTEALRDILTPYWWLLNSSVAVALFREYCPNVAGGQLDLEHKYVRHIPLPNLSVAIRNDPGLSALAAETRARFGEELPPLDQRDVFSAAAYGTRTSDWPGLGHTTTDAV